MSFTSYSNSNIYKIISSIVSSNKKRLNTVELPYNSTSISIAHLLLRNNQISGYNICKQYGRHFVLVSLRYPNNKPMLFSLKFISKPGRRVYISAQCLRTMLLKMRFSILVMSTPFGIVSGLDAVLLNSGGEIICVLN
jgi:small subunit ribosomal protein S8